MAEYTFLRYAVVMITDGERAIHLEFEETPWRCDPLSDGALRLLTPLFSSEPKTCSDARFGVKLHARYLHPLFAPLRHRLLVAHDVERPQEPLAAALVTCRFMSRVATLSLFAVQGGYRGKGLGSSFLEYIEEHCALHGASVMFLDSGVGAFTFYEQRGYEPLTPTNNVHRPMQKSL